MAENRSLRGEFQGQHLAACNSDLIHHVCNLQVIDDVTDAPGAKTSSRPIVAKTILAETIVTETIVTETIVTETEATGTETPMLPPQ